jgi:hypothetical protein
MDSSEAYAKAETCARLAKMEFDPVKRTALEFMHRLWLMIAEKARRPDVDLTEQFEKLSALHTLLYQQLGIGHTHSLN